MSSRFHQPPLIPRFSRWLVVGLLCISLGLQWTMLQGIAWTGMLISYASEGSLIEAVSKTFDGEHPCALCKAVEEGQKQDQDKSVETPKKKLDAVLVLTLPVIAPAPVLLDFPQFKQDGKRRATMPPRQPPRSLASLA